VAVEVKTMEVKKTQQLSKPVAAETTETVVKSGQWRNFLGDIKDEFKKISWTTPEELRTYTKIVVAGTLILGMGIYLMDLTIQGVLSGLNFLMRLISA
jgi:preprotein translocase subunit SecE